MTPPHIGHILGSGGIPTDPRLFLDLLRARRLTLTSLALLAGCGRSHLSQVVNGHPGRGGLTRRKVARHLRPEELAALGWDSMGRRKDPPSGNAPLRPMFHVGRTPEPSSPPSLVFPEKVPRRTYSNLEQTSGEESR